MGEVLDSDFDSWHLALACSLRLGAPKISDADVDVAGEEASFRGSVSVHQHAIAPADSDLDGQCGSHASTRRHGGACNSLGASVGAIRCCPTLSLHTFPDSL